MNGYTSSLEYCLILTVSDNTCSVTAARRPTAHQSWLPIVLHKRTIFTVIHWCVQCMGERAET